ncbi:MAG: hypothetical protein ACRECO_08025 [Xanthobacteraceae bacterium]
MNLPRYAILTLGFAAFGAVAPAGAQTQPNKDSPWDLNQLVPPTFPLPPRSQVNPGGVDGTTTPYTTAPLQNPTQRQTQPTPGLKLSIPTR